MFERFTEKAIKVVTYAQEEAINARHAKLYPEHILLGILREGSGISARFLRTSGLTTEVLREKIKKSAIIRKNENISNSILPFSPIVKKILKEAWDEARSPGVNYITTEHLFLSLLNEDNVEINDLLEEFDVNISKIKASVLKLVEKKSKASSHPEINQKHSSFVSGYFTLSSISSIFQEKDSACIMNRAREKMEESACEALGTDQILFAMLEDKDSYLYNLLENEGIVCADIIKKLENIESRSAEYDDNKCLFTPGAFFIINKAYELAKELGSSSIQPEHIFLGLLKEKKGVSYEILNQLGIDTENLYNKIINPIEKQKPVTLTIINLAKEEARRLGRNIVGTEQILLGLLGEGTGIAAIVLHKLGITLKDARIEAEKLVGYGDGYLEKEMTFTPRFKKLLEIAWSKAKKFNSPRIESEHLLLGIIKEEECMAMKILENLGVDTLEIKQGILKAIEEKKYNISSSNDDVNIESK